MSALLGSAVQPYQVLHLALRVGISGHVGATHWELPLSRPRALSLSQTDHRLLYAFRDTNPLRTLSSISDIKLNGWHLCIFAL